MQERYLQLRHLKAEFSLTLPFRAERGTSLFYREKLSMLFDSNIVHQSRRGQIFANLNELVRIVLVKTREIFL